MNGRICELDSDSPEAWRAAVAALPAPDLRTLAERERDDVTALQRRVEVLEQKLAALIALLEVRL